MLVTDKLINEGIYTVKAGDTLYAIAKKYETTVEAIKKLNNLNTNNLYIGQKLQIPSKVSVNSHIVKSGETLYSIAKKYNTTVDAIKIANNLKSNMLSINQVLVIPK